MNQQIKSQINQNISEQNFSIEVTTECNCACRHCFARESETNITELSIDLARTIIAEAFQTGYRHLHITGGEPLLWANLFELIDIAYSIGFDSIFLNTNGTLLTNRSCLKLANFRNLYLSVSLEGDEDLHNKLRGEGFYYKTLQGIDNAIKAGIETIIFSIACKTLLSVLPSFADGLNKKFKTIKYLILIPLSCSSEKDFYLSEELLQPSDFILLIQTVSLLNLWEYNIGILNDPLSNVVSCFLDMPWMGKTHPLIRNGRMVVKADQKIYASHSSQKFFGNYSPGIIQQILMSVEYRQAVAPDKKICPNCRFHDICRLNGKIQPTPALEQSNTSEPYCKTILDIIDHRSE